ncbi:MAG: 2-oxo acid dehydrogenase subunit E2 [Acidobacteria bacterium]|nr:2-oxo acid dehydrogenase subunit E2 [Acidobacteriota bacterium]
MTTITEFRLPPLTDSVTTVRLSLWLKQVGDRVQVGEPMVEVETDKTNIELEAPATGVVQAIHVTAGTEGIQAGTLLAVIADGPAGEAAADDVGAPAVASTPPKAAEERGIQAAGGDADPVATPLARRMAVLAGLALAEVTGSGRDGQVTKRDVDRALTGWVPTSETLAARSMPSGTSTSAAPSGGAEEASTPARPPGTAQTVRHLYLRIECDAEAALGLLASATRLRADRAPTLTDLVIRASAFALRMVPRANAGWVEVDGRARVGTQSDIAVAVHTPAGVLTPIVRGADRKDLAAIATETRGFHARAQAGELHPDECAGSAFTVSNLGRYGVESLYASVIPPQRCLLGVGAVVSRPVAVGSHVRVGQVLACTLSADRRIIDDAVWAELLAAIRDHIEQPGLMLV